MVHLSRHVIADPGVELHLEALAGVTVAPRIADAQLSCRCGPGITGPYLTSLVNPIRSKP